MIQDQVANGLTTPVLYQDPTTNPTTAPPDPGQLLLQMRDAGIPIEEVEVPISSEIKITPEILEDAKQYSGTWMKYSYEYMQRKLPDYLLFENLYYNRCLLDDIGTSQSAQRRLYEEVPAATRLRKALEKVKGGAWRSQHVIAVQPIVDSYVERVCKIIFGSPDYFSVKARPRTNDPIPSVEDQKYSTAEKLERFIIETSNDMQFPSRVEEQIRSAVMFGPGVTKEIWYQDSQFVRIYLRNPVTRELVRTEEVREKVYRQGVLHKKIKLDKFLPDPLADTTDIDLWTGIGDRTYVEYSQLLADFQTPDNPKGMFNCGHEEFLSQWSEGELLSDSINQGIELDVDDDQDTVSSSSPIRALQAWELHGKWRPKGYPDECECVFTIITGLSATDPSGGVLVRLNFEPVLEIRRRPYTEVVFSATGGPMGMGIIEPNLDLIWMLSHSEGLYLDIVRIASIPLVAAQEDSPIFDESEDAELSDIAFPGKILKVSGPNDLSVFSLSGSDLSSLLNWINMKRAELRERTSVSDISRGVEGPQRKTATESSMLFSAAQESLGTKITRIKDSVLEPYGKIALCFFKQNITQNQELPLQGSDGVVAPATLTVEEICTGQYDVEAVFDLPQEAKVSRAQNIINMLPILKQFEQDLMFRYNKKIRWDNLIEAPVKLLGMADSTKALDTATDQDIQQMIALMAPPQQGEEPPPEEQQSSENNGPPPELPQGGPLGPEQSDANEQMLMQQMMAALQSPVTMGMQGPA